MDRKTGTRCHYPNTALDKLRHGAKQIRVIHKRKHLFPFVSITGCELLELLSVLLLLFTAVGDIPTLLTSWEAKSITLPQKQSGHTSVKSPGTTLASAPMMELYDCSSSFKKDIQQTSIEWYPNKSSCHFFLYHIWHWHCVFLSLICKSPTRLRDNFRQQKHAKVKVELIYKEYRHKFCFPGLLEPKNRAEFGKLVKLAFPQIKKRRLGPAGSQVSFYFGLGPKPIPRPMLLPPSPFSPPLQQPMSSPPSSPVADKNSFQAEETYETISAGEESFSSLEPDLVLLDLELKKSADSFGGASCEFGVVYTEDRDWMHNFPSYSCFFSYLLAAGGESP